jgi:hypothetical protein
VGENGIGSREGDPWDDKTNEGLSIVKDTKPVRNGSKSEGLTEIEYLRGSTLQRGARVTHRLDWNGLVAKRGSERKVYSLGFLKK